MMMTRETVRAFGVGGLVTAGIFFLVSYLEMGELDAALEAGAAEMIREADGEVVSVNQDNLHLHDQYYVLWHWPIYLMIGWTVFCAVVVVWPGVLARPAGRSAN